MDGPTRGRINQLIVEMSPLGHEIHPRLLVEALAQDLIRQGAPASLKTYVKEFERQTAIRSARGGRAQPPAWCHLRVRLLGRLMRLAREALRTLPADSQPFAWEQTTCLRIEEYNRRDRAWVVHLARRPAPPQPEDPVPAKAQAVAAFLCSREVDGRVELCRIPSHIGDVEAARDWQRQREERKAEPAARLWPVGEEIIGLEQEIRKASSSFR